MAGSVISLLLCLTLHAVKLSALSSSLETRYVNAVEGTVFLDSSYSRNGNTVLHIYLSEAENTFSGRASCRGTATAVCREHALICAGTKVRLTGSFTDSYFVCSEIRVLEKGPLQYIRSHLILLVTKQLAGTQLGELLILGRNDPEGPEQNLIDLARSCGCMHVLALSGMHLNIVGTLVYKGISHLTGKKKLARIISLICASAFVFVAGPRPSLLRAWLAYMLFFIDYRERPALCFFVHLLAAPWSLFSRASVFCYVSVGAIACLSPLLSGALGNNALGTAMAVLLFNAPLQMLFNGRWYPCAVAAGPLSALLVSAVTGLCLLCIPLGGSSFAGHLANRLTAVLESLFVRFSALPDAGVPEYAVLAAVCVFLVTATRLRYNQNIHSGGLYGKRIHG